MNLKKIIVIHNKSTDKNGILKHRILGFFEDRKIDTVCLEVNQLNHSVREIENLDLVIVVGGDGTFLTGVHSFLKTGIPIVGVNTGHLGFLTRIDPDSLEEKLKAIINKDFRIAPKMMLEIIEPNYLALNDVVIKNSNPSKLTKINVFIDDELLAEYDADGLILATSTGSTAYNLSANGPIIDPRANVIAITPICPHSISAKPIIVSSSHKLTIKSDDTNNDSLLVSVDGLNSFYLNKNEEFTVIESQYKVPFITFKAGSFYDLLKSKLGWGINVRTTSVKKYTP